MDENKPCKHVYAPHYFRRVGACITQSLNTILFCSKNPCESLSARSWRKRDERFFGFVRLCIDAWFHLLGFPNHCENAAQDDYLRALSYVEANYQEQYSRINREHEHDDQ